MSLRSAEDLMKLANSAVRHHRADIQSRGNDLDTGMSKPERIKIPFTCPRCQETGAVHVHKLDRSIRCKMCDAIFHLNRRFEVTVGSPEVEAPLVVRRASEFRGSLIPLFIRRAAPWLTPARLALALAAVVVLGLAGWLTTFRGPVEGLPTTLSGRMVLFAKNWVENDISEIRHVTDPTLLAHVDAWWKSSKKSLGGVKSLEQIETAVLFENRRENVAATTIAIPGDRNSAMILFWKLQSDNTWLFDPQRSIRESGRQDSQ